MEILCTILAQGRAESVNYTDSHGQPATFTKMPFHLRTGDSTLYAEMLGEKALKTPLLDASRLYQASIMFRAEERTDKQGNKFFSNRITLIAISVI